MRVKLLLLLFLCGFISAWGQQKDTTTFFEGYIDYKTEFQSLMAGVSDNEIRDRVGEFLRIYYNESGDFKWVFSDNSGFVRSYQLILASKNKSYDWSDNNPDSLLVFDLRSSKRISIDNIEELGADTVIGCVCKVIKLNGAMTYENPLFSISTKFIYSFCPSLRVNPDRYTNFKEFRWDELTRKYGSIAVKMVSHFENSAIGIFTALSVTPVKVDPSIFSIDKTKIIKQTFTE